MTETLVRLSLRDLRIDMPIGIFEEDKAKLCPLLINLVADVRLPEDRRSDCYDDVLGYDKLRAMVLEICGAGHLNLLETLAESIVERCFAWPQVAAASVKIEKTAIFPDCIPGVEISRVRG